MKACLLALFICALSGAAFGASKNVNLTVTNPTEATLDVIVQVKNKKGVIKQNIELGSVTQNQQATRSFKVDVDGQYSVNAFLHNSALVFDESRTVLKADPDPITSTTTLSIKHGNLLKIETAQTTLKNLFSDLGPELGFKPIQVNDGLQTVLGGLFLITPPNGNEKGVVHFKLTPAQFSNVTPTASFQYPQNDETNEVDMTSSFAAAAAATIPVVGQLGMNFSRDTLYKVKWEMRGFGPVEKVEPPDWSYARGLASLNTNDRDALCQALIENPTAQLLYVNKIYVINDARFEVKEGQRLEAGSKADAGTIVTGSAAYKFMDSTGSIKNYRTSILNIEGVRLSFTKTSAGAITGAFTCSATTDPGTGTLTAVGSSSNLPASAITKVYLNLRPRGNMLLSADMYEAMVNK